MTDETPDVVSRARAALDERATPTNAGHGHVRPRLDGSRARCGGPRLCKECQQEAARTPDPWDLVRDLLAENERLRDDLRVERITTHLCESVDADLREARAEVERLQTKCETPGDAASDLAADGEATS